jgi:hypothetical protein
MTKGAPWPDEHSEALRSLVASRSGSYADYAKALNRQFGTTYTRCAVIGRGERMQLSQPNLQRARGPDSIKDRHKKVAQQRREKRWAENPSLEARYNRKREQAVNRSLMLAGGATKTSRAYRSHMPRVSEMTKGELRAMLTAAVQNTAAMELA